MADGRLKTTGKLVLTRVDRNVALTPKKGYAGPVHGPLITCGVMREATFVPLSQRLTILVHMRLTPIRFLSPNDI